MIDRSTGVLDCRAEKARLRRRLLAGRRARADRDPDWLATAGRRLADVADELAIGAGAVIAAYASVGTEPGTGALLDRLDHRGVRVLLPVLAPGDNLVWAWYDGRLQPSDRGLLEPVGHRLGPSALAAAQLVLVPALAVDLAGRRLGRGAGYYDRVLAALPAGRRVVAVVYDDEVLPSVPTEAHDQPVGSARTPTRLRAFPSPPGG